jgi:hypothetical protein
LLNLNLYCWSPSSSSSSSHQAIASTPSAPPHRSAPQELVTMKVTEQRDFAVKVKAHVWLALIPCHPLGLSGRQSLMHTTNTTCREAAKQAYTV